MKRFAAVLILLALLACALAPSYAEESGEDMSLGDFIRSVNPDAGESEETEESEETQTPLEMPDSEEGEIFAQFLQSADFAQQNYSFDAVSCAVFDIDSDGVAELIIDGGMEGSGDRIFRFYALYDGIVMGVGEIESEVIDDWLGYSPMHNGVAARISIADMEIYSIYALDDELELRCGLTESHDFAESDVGTELGQARHEYVVNGVTSDLPAEEWDAFQSDLQKIEFRPFEMNFSGEIEAGGGAPMEENAELIGPGTLTQTQLNYLREAFEIPDDIVITDYDYDPNGSYFWDGGGVWIVNIELFSGNQCVGSALAYADTLEPVRMVWNYPDRISMDMSDPSQMVWR